MRWNHWLGLILFGISTTFFIITAWPPLQHSSEITFSQEDGVIWNLEISQPFTLHLNDATEINLKVSTQSNQETKHNTYLISKLEFGSLGINPTGEGKVLVDTNEPVRLSWQVIAHQKGSYSGTLWLFYQPFDGEKQLILARDVELNATSILGFDYPKVRMVSILCALISFVFIIPKSKILLNNGRQVIDNKVH